MDTDDLPQYDENDYLGDKGVRMVDQLVSEEFRWIFRDLRKADLGIDAQIELVSPEMQGTGRLIAAQIKCGPSYLGEKTEVGFVFRGKGKHLRYWVEHSLPVIVVLCNPEDGKCYWQEVSGANTEPFGKGWKIVVPYTHILGVTSKDTLTQIAGRPQHGDIVEALLHSFLYEKYVRQIEFVTTFELPHDYHAYAYLATISGELVMIGTHHDQYGKIQVEDLMEVVRWKKFNQEQCGATKLHIYVSSESRRALRFSLDVEQYIASLPDVEVFPVLYTRSPMFLSEISVFDLE